MHCDTTQFTDFTSFFYEKKKEAEKKFGLISYGADKEYEFAQKEEFGKFCEEWNKEHSYYIFENVLPKIYEYIGKGISVGENSRTISEEETT
jgi:hypothetical protein